MKYKIVAAPMDPMDVESQDEPKNNEELEPPAIVLTRYLYIKDEVLVSLVLSILEKNKDEALFWAYELYNSGFEECAIEFVFSIYTEMFKAHNYKLGKFISNRIAEWKEDRTRSNVIGTIVINLCDSTRKFNVDGFITRNFPIPSKTNDSTFYIIFEGASKYDHVAGILPRKLLETACVYSSRKYGNVVFNCAHAKCSAKYLKNLLFYNWLYFASFSPIWSDRITRYNGNICHENHSVVFEDPDEFYDLYGYEPDEQNLDVISKISHVKEHEQLTVKEFITNYNLIGGK
jgi:hypothetical protein